MRWSYNLERSRAVAAWLFVIAGLVLAMVLVGGATRLTGSGLSITQWNLVTGVLPPLSHHAWAAKFASYRQIPQYRLLNRGMTLGQFQFIFWWEWSHRLLGRLLGLVILVPLVVFLAIKRIPRRLVWRCWAVMGLVALQGLIGWWMVASGLEARVYVAPERLALHLGTALFLYGFAVWTGLEAWSGRPRGVVGIAPRWRAWATGLLVLVGFQILLGALVAGNQAGYVYNDWPMMNGRFFPADYVRGGVWSTLLHSQAAVQFDHRMVAYVTFAVALGLGLAALGSRVLPPAVKSAAAVLAAAVTLQVALGIATLMSGAPLALSLIHQFWAVMVLTCAIVLLWRIRRA